MKSLKKQSGDVCKASKALTGGCWQAMDLKLINSSLTVGFTFPTYEAQQEELPPSGVRAARPRCSRPRNTPLGRAVAGRAPPVGFLTNPASVLLIVFLSLMPLFLIPQSVIAGNGSISGRTMISGSVISNGSLSANSLHSSQSSILMIDTDPTIGLGSEEVTDLTQFGAMFYTLGNGDVGFRIMYDPEHDGIANPEFTEMRYKVHLNPGDNKLVGGYAAIPTGTIDITRITPAINVMGTPTIGSQALSEYAMGLIGATDSLPLENNGKRKSWTRTRNRPTSTKNAIQFNNNKRNISYIRWTSNNAKTRTSRI